MRARCEMRTRLYARCGNTQARCDEIQRSNQIQVMCDKCVREYMQDAMRCARGVRTVARAMDEIWSR
eukprot:1528693-Pleurochrysis_carterae.AAC.3